MRQQLPRQISVAVLAMMLALTFMQILASAQEEQQDIQDIQLQSTQESQDEQQSEDSRKSSVNARRIEGVWEAQATLRVCQTGAPIATFRAMSKFIRGGSLLDTNATPPTTRGPGFGRWQYLGGLRYRAVFRFFRYNPDGSFAGVTRVTRNIVLSREGDDFTGTGSAEIFDANDNLIGTGCNTETAKRVE